MKPLCTQSLFVPHTVPLSRNASFHIFLCFCWVIYIFLIRVGFIIYLFYYFFSSILYNASPKQNRVRSLPTPPVKEVSPSPVPKLITPHTALPQPGAEEPGTGATGTPTGTGTASSARGSGRAPGPSCLAPRPAALPVRSSLGPARPFMVVPLAQRGAAPGAAGCLLVHSPVLEGRFQAPGGQ